MLEKVKLKFAAHEIRNRKLFFTTISSLGTKFINALVAFISLPLTYNYLDSERFGVMVTIVSVLGAFNFLDLGLGFGLQNRWAELERDKTGLTKKETVSSVFFFLTLIGVLLLVFAIITYYYANLSKLFFNDHSSTDLVEETRNTAIVFFLILAFSFPFSLVQKIQIGNQEGYITNIWLGAANIFSLILLLFFTYLKLSIGFIVFALYGITNLFNIFNFTLFFVIQRRESFPNLRYFSISSLKLILRDSLAYLIQQVSTTLLWVSNSVLLAKYCGAEVVGNFHVGLKLITLFLIPIESSAPFLLPAYNDAFEKKDFWWLKNISKKFLQVCVLYALFIFLVIILGADFIIKIWMNRVGLLNFFEILSFAILAVSTVFYFYSSFIMLTTKFIGIVIKVYPIAILISIILKWLLVDVSQIQGINYAQSFGLSVFFFVPTLVILRKNKII